MIRKNLTKQNIADKINLKLGFSKEEAKFFIENFFSIIQDKVVLGEEVKIPKLGNFSSRKKNERYGRNPKTGEEALITKRKVVRFKSSKLLKNNINR
ncbi:MAG: Integration host factor subunit alpha [Alphaproteobacteria bacterium MarineAlpha9_Bin4]|nr:MAG: Integration host factor subunit alpha [Alphaproteobacteria bacterium MarineAlpha9_Bin4]